MQVEGVLELPFDSVQLEGRNVRDQEGKSHRGCDTSGFLCLLPFRDLLEQGLLEFGLHHCVPQYLIPIKCTVLPAGRSVIIDL